MYLAHFNPNPIKLPPPVARQLTKTAMSAQERFNYEMALKGFKNACKKHAAAIAEIREVFPDYEPKFTYNPK